MNNNDNVIEISDENSSNSNSDNEKGHKQNYIKEETLEISSDSSSTSEHSDNQNTDKLVKNEQVSSLKNENCKFSKKLDNLQIKSNIEDSIVLSDDSDDSCLESKDIKKTGENVVTNDERKPLHNSPKSLIQNLENNDTSINSKTILSSNSDSHCRRLSFEKEQTDENNLLNIANLNNNKVETENSNLSKLTYDKNSDNEIDSSKNVLKLNEHFECSTSTTGDLKTNKDKITSVTNDFVLENNFDSVQIKYRLLDGKTCFYTEYICFGNLEDSFIDEEYLFSWKGKFIN